MFLRYVAKTDTIGHPSLNSDEESMKCQRLLQKIKQRPVPTCVSDVSTFVKEYYDVRAHAVDVNTFYLKD